MPNLKGVKLTVGSRDFSEVMILGYVAIIALKAAGAEIVDRTNIKGTQGQRQAMLVGGVDLGWEYTGGAWITYLGNTQPVPESKAQYEAVRKADAANGITWMSLAPMNNQYALAVTAATQRKYNLRTDSDAVDLIKKQPSLGTFCVEAEFANRDDGLPGMKKKYQFNTVPSNVKLMDLGLIYTQTAKGGCTFGEVYTTDGRIAMLGLKVLEDDRRFFPIYNIAMNVRSEIARKYPEIQRVFDPVAARLTTAEIAKLNARVDVNGQEPSKVAMDWMLAQGFVTTGTPANARS